MKYYMMSDPSGDYVYSEEDIISEYWVFWKDQMDDKYGPNHELTTESTCIDDWAIVHWAQEIPLSLYLEKKSEETPSD